MIGKKTFFSQTFNLPLKCKSIQTQSKHKIWSHIYLNEPHLFGCGINENVRKV